MATNIRLSSIRPGSVVEFMQGDQPQLAFVLDEQSGKARLWTINKREMKMPAARLLPWIGPEYSPDASRQEIQDTLNRHQENRGAIQAGLDVMELWELAQGELSEADLDWFAGLLWEEPTPDQQAALGRAMLSAKTHFKFRPPKFEVYSEEMVELRLKRQAEEKAREAVTRTGQDLFKSLWEAKRNGAAPKLPTMDEEIAVRLEQLLKHAVADTLDDDQAKIWTALKKGLPDHPHLAMLIGQQWGIFPEHHNFHLDLAGFEWGDAWSSEHATELEALKERFAADDHEVDDTPFISIDGPTTRDIDDAFHLERVEDGYRLKLALARPCAHWEFGGALDRAVFNRATSLYLPEGSSHMLPECLGTGQYSLLQDESRPAMVVEFSLDAEGQLLSTTPTLTWVTLRENTTYEAVESKLDSDAGMLAAALELAEKLMARRIEDGACIIRKPEPQVSVEGFPENAEVSIELKEDFPRAELLVSEFMILANRGLALWAAENEVPLLHRTQAIALPPEAAGIFSDPSDIAAVVRLLAPTTLEVDGKPHAALGVNRYAPITSPLRRYTDFLNMSQVESFLKTGTPRLNYEELSTLLPNLSGRIQSVSQVQRFRPRYWKLHYLALHKNEWHSAIVADDHGPLPSLAMPQIQINVRAPIKVLGEKLYPGQRFALRFGKIDPLTNEIKVVEALEE